VRSFNASDFSRIITLSCSGTSDVTLLTPSTGFSGDLHRRYFAGTFDKRLHCAYKVSARRGALELGYTAPAVTAGRFYSSNVR
jgi:hypothetical protein